MRKVSCFFVFILAFLISCSGSQVIITDLSEKDANEVIVYLASQGIVAAKEAAPTSGTGANADQLWNISVAGGKSTEAMALLNKQGLPRKPGDKLLDIFQPSGLVPSEQEETVRYQAGLASQIAGIIRKIDGIIDADVQLSIPAVAGTQPITAAVYVKHQGVMDNPNNQLENKIKRLVSSSVSGLSYENVSVIPDRAVLVDVGSSYYSDLMPEEEKEYVAIWGVVVSKESVSHFQRTFLTFSIIILFLLLLLIWTLWKLLPILPELGGYKALLSLRPLVLPEPQVEEPLEAPPAAEEPVAVEPVAAAPLEPAAPVKETPANPTEEEETPTRK